MDVRILGEGQPSVSVVACVHGDETAGVEAIDRFLAESHDLQAPVQFIVANEEAREAGKRSIDADLNRSFPGTRESDAHEIRLAPEILKRVRDTKVLDLHSTPSMPTPYAFCVHYSLETAHLVRSTGVDRVVDPRGIESSGGGLVSACSGVLVECGPKGQPKAIETAQDVLENFLAANGVLEAPYEYPADPQVYRVFERIDHPVETTEFHGQNFNLIREGDRYLSVEGEPVIADQDFYPVLASDSDDGAPFVGFKAKNVGTLHEMVL